MTTSSPLTPAHLRRALLAALALLALGAGVAPGHAVASSGPAGTSDADTITTTLYPGWNMVGWVGPSTPTSELFDMIPALRQVSAWDAEAQAYQHAVRNRYDELPTLTPGVGLWLRLDGSSTVEWSRRVRPDGFVIRMEPGVNIVAIAADGGVTSVGLVAASARRWNPVIQRFESYEFGDETLGRGDALQIEVPSAVNWWQPGTPDQAPVFVGDVPAETRAAILAEYERAKEFFADRFGIVTAGPRQYIASDSEALRGVYDSVLKFELPTLGDNSCAYSISNRLTVRSLEYCGYPRFTMVLDLSANLRAQLPVEWRWRGALPAVREPHWLLIGAGSYPAFAFAETNEPTDIAETNEPTARYRAWSRYEARPVAIPLRNLEATDLHGINIVMSTGERALSLFAVEHLVRLAGEPALFEYLRRLRIAADSGDTFATVFGLTVEDFYDSFEHYRAEAFPPLPHLADDLDVPVLLLLDGVPADTGSAIRDEFEAVRRFFATRFKAEVTELTLYIAPDADAVLAAGAWHVREGCWLSPSRGIVAFALDLCSRMPRLDYTYFFGARSELAHHHPPAPAGFTGGWAERWFDMGAELYSLAAYEESRGRRSYITYRNSVAATVVGNPYPLERIQTTADVDEVGANAAWSLGFLAVEWLANHAGDPAVFDYYRRLPEAESFAKAFEGAFGLTFEEFYEQFEAYRATLTAP